MAITVGYIPNNNDNVKEEKKVIRGYYGIFNIRRV